MAIETHIIEFSVDAGKDRIKDLLDRSGLSFDHKYNQSNGGVTFGLRITGERSVLKRIVKKYGYPGQNRDLEDIKPGSIESWL